MADNVTVHVELRAVPGPGTEIGAYRIVDLLGTGGMGQVFLAEHKKLGRRVALKLLLPEFAGNRDVISRFFHEAKAVNQINHQHIVEIVDFVEDPGGFNYFIMELLDGRDLAQSREHDGPFSLERTVSIICARSSPRSPPPTPRPSSTATSSRRTSSSSAARETPTSSSCWTSASPSSRTRSSATRGRAPAPA